VYREDVKSALLQYLDRFIVVSLVLVVMGYGFCG